MAQTGRLKGINWPTLGFIAGYHLALLIGLPFYFYYSPPGAGLIVISIILLFLTEIGIGAAYHRYYAHRAYAMSKPAEAVLLFLGNMATQGSVLTWAHDHRLHHSFVDTDRDPYSIKKGFWYAHILWMFHKPIRGQFRSKAKHLSDRVSGRHRGHPRRHSPTARAPKDTGPAPTRCEFNQSQTFAGQNHQKVKATGLPQKDPGSPARSDVPDEIDQPALRDALLRLGSPFEKE